MGADLLLCSIPAFELTEERKASFIAAVREDLLCRNDAMDYLLDCYGDVDADDTDEMKADKCVELFDAAISQVDENCRDVATIRFEGMDHSVLVTGGMSWGDAPTESFNEVSVVCEVGDEPYRLMLKWAKEDFATT